jgi:glycosyltransferase involved in cell wall biosynthesis
MNMYETPKLDRDLTAFVEQIAINRAAVRTACSRFVATEVRDQMGVAEPIHVIPNGIDLDAFDRDPGIDVHARFGLPQDRLLVLFANRLEERKGIHLIGKIALSVMKRHAAVDFVLAGRDLFNYVSDRVMPSIQEAGLAARFHVLGGLDLAHVRALLKRCDIFLVPSLWENCPYSCIEAMAAGRAIVASDCGGMPELITHRQNGLLARTDFSESFVERLQELIESADLRQRLGSAARQTVQERLTDVEVARRTVDVYQTALSSDIENQQVTVHSSHASR